MLVKKMVNTSSIFNTYLIIMNRSKIENELNYSYNKTEKSEKENRGVHFPHIPSPTPRKLIQIPLSNWERNREWRKMEFNRVGKYCTPLNENAINLWIKRTCMYPHVSVPCWSIIQSLGTYRTFLPFFRISHSSGLQLLHVVIQLHLSLEYQYFRLLWFCE